MGKKDFGSLKSPIGGNTALNFISADPIVNQEEAVEEKNVEEVVVSKGHRRVGRPKLRETRSQRVVLLLKPSFYEEVRKRADEMDVSVNVLYEKIMKEYLENSDD